MTRMWTLGTMAAGLGLVVGLFLYLFVLGGGSPTGSPEIGLALFGPYFLCGFIVLFTNGAQVARILAVLLLASGLALDVFVAWEFTDAVIRGVPSAMPVSVFIGALILLGQYAVTVPGVFAAWIYWMATPWQAPPPPTQEQRDYAD